MSKNSISWEHVHDEDIGPAVTLHMFLGTWKENGAHVMLFEVNRQGIAYDIYSHVEDALEGTHPLASICYGESVMMEDPDEFFTLCLQNIGGKPLGCDHPGRTCEERFHQAQVELENEDPDACLWCTAPDRKESN